MALPHTLQLWKLAQLLLELLTSADDLGRFFLQILATVPGETVPNPLVLWLSVLRLDSSGH